MSDIKRTVATEVILRSAQWLPEDCVLHLTCLDLGALMAILLEGKNRGIGLALIRQPGPDGNPVDVTMVDRLIEKVEAARLHTVEQQRPAK